MAHVFICYILYNIWWQGPWTLYGCLTVFTCSLVHYQKTNIRNLLIWRELVITDKPLIVLPPWNRSVVLVTFTGLFLYWKQFLGKCAFPNFCLLFNWSSLANNIESFCQKNSNWTLNNKSPSLKSRVKCYSKWEQASSQQFFHFWCQKRKKPWEQGWVETQFLNLNENLH